MIWVPGNIGESIALGETLASKMKERFRGGYPMSALIEGLATNPREAYRVCDVKPLEGDLIDRYYVPFESRQDAIIGVNSLLQTQEAGETSCILFTGHVGCGKSSELARIARFWQNDYAVIYIRASEETDVNDAQYVDLYLIIIVPGQRRQIAFLSPPRS